MVLSFFGSRVGFEVRKVSTFTRNESKESGKLMAVIKRLCSKVINGHASRRLK